MKQEDNQRLAYFPVNLFGVVMGYCGFTLVLEQAVSLSLLPEYFFITSAIASTLLFAGITSTYLIKLIRYPHAVQAEFNHPATIHFFPTFSISLILLSLIFKDVDSQTGLILWLLGTLLQFSFLLAILNNWIHHEKWQIIQMNPAWFIPVVGNIVVPIGAINYASTELGWFFFSIGLVFWLILNSIVMYRLFFHTPLIKQLEPTLFILIAPPAVGFISYMALQGMNNVDSFARILYYIGLFLTLLHFSQLPRFIKVPFSLSWWAYTFPLAAITLASLIMYGQLEIDMFLYFSIGFFVVLSALIIHLTVKTVWAIKMQKICLPPTQADTAKFN